MATTAPWQSSGVREGCLSSRIASAVVAGKAAIEPALVEQGFPARMSRHGCDLAQDDEVIPTIQDVVAAALQPGHATWKQRYPSRTCHPAQPRPFVSERCCKASGQLRLLNFQNVDGEVAGLEKDRQAEGTAIDAKEHQRRIHRHG